MKFLIVTFLILSSGLLQARGIHAVLDRYDTSVEDLGYQGYKVLDGEWTWVGKKLDVDKLRMILTKKELVKMEDVVELEFKSEQDRFIENIKALKLRNKTISNKAFEAVIIK